jgi:hypothetical protein
VLVPAQLPTGASAPRFGVIRQTTGTFTFSAELARQAAARLGQTPPPMPANIDGSHLYISGGPAVIEYFADTTRADSPYPRLIVAQGKGPVVRSDGVTVEDLQRYLLAQPGVTPELAARIRAIKDPSSTLPIPIPVDRATSKMVTVQGVSAVFVGDSTGLGSAVIWSKDGIVYGVAGTVGEAELIAIANSLH